jgi:hypothetical protein
MTDLPNFSADFSAGLKKIVYTLTGGELTQVPLEGVVVEFTSNVPQSEWITFDGAVFPATAPRGVAIEQVAAVVAADGTLQGTGDPVKLLANDPGLNVTGVQWTAVVRIPGRKRMRPFVFDAPSDGAELDLSTAAPAVPATAEGVPVTMEMVDAAIAAALADFMPGGGSGTSTIPTTIPFSI